MQLGQFLRKTIPITDGSGTPVAPTAAPRLRTYDPTFSLVDNVPMTPAGFDTGMFTGKVFLDGDYSPGLYTGLVTWSSSGNDYSSGFSFEVLAGGSAAGQVVGMSAVEYHGRQVIVAQLDGGTIKAGRDPRT